MANTYSTNHGTYQYVQGNWISKLFGIKSQEEKIMELYSGKPTGIYNHKGTLVAVYQRPWNEPKVIIGKNAYQNSGLDLLPVAELDNKVYNVGDYVDYEGKQHKVVRTNSKQAHLEQLGPIKIAYPKSSNQQTKKQPVNTTTKSTQTAPQKTKPQATVKKTSGNSKVKQLQQQLVDLGFYDNNSSKEVDGIIGKRTRKAIKQAEQSGYTLNGYTLEFHPQQDNSFPTIEELDRQTSRIKPREPDTYDTVSSNSNTSSPQFVPFSPDIDGLPQFPKQKFGPTQYYKVGGVINTFKRRNKLLRIK